MKKVIAIAAMSLLLAGCDCDKYRKHQLIDGGTIEAPEGAIVKALIKMPDGSLEKVNAKRWRQYNTSISIDTDDREFLTGVNNVVMIFNKPQKKESK